MSKDTPKCTETKASCKCLNDLNHEGPHECDCGGSWLGEEIYSFPKTGDILDLVLDTYFTNEQ